MIHEEEKKRGLLTYWHPNLHHMRSKIFHELLKACKDKKELFNIHPADLDLTIYNQNLTRTK